MKTIRIKINGEIVEYERENDDLETINKIIDDWTYEGVRDCMYEVI